MVFLVPVGWDDVSYRILQPTTGFVQHGTKSTMVNLGQQFIQLVVLLGTSGNVGVGDVRIRKSQNVLP
jgi:hypothetical protein